MSTDMLKQDNIKEKVYDIISDCLNVSKDKISDDKSFVEDLSADSLDLTELVMSLEESFSFEVPPKDIEQLKSVQDVLNYIYKSQMSGE